MNGLCSRCVIVTVAVLVLTACDGVADSEARRLLALEHAARAVARGDDRVDAADLAAWIVEGSREHAVIDVRDAEAFEAGHVPEARRMAITDVVSESGMAALPHDRLLVLYGDDGGDAVQAAVLLRLAGLDAYFLRGGFQAWLHATAADGVTEQQPERARERRAMSCYFREDYEPAAGFVEQAGYVPTLAPVSPAATPELDTASASMPLAPRAGLTPRVAPTPQAGEALPDEEPQPAPEAETLELIIEEGC